MEAPYLIQRLQDAGKVDLLPSLAGWYATPKSRDLTPEEASCLNTTLYLDYMGSSEFEYGAVPDSFRLFAQQPDLVTSKSNFADGPTIYVLSRKDDQVDVMEFLRQQVYGQYKGRLQETTCIRETILPHTQTRPPITRYIGWYDLGNHWFASTKSSLVQKVISLLGVNTTPNES